MNKVQNENSNKHGRYSVDILQEYFVKGYRMHYIPEKNISVSAYTPSSIMLKREDEVKILREQNEH